MLRYLNHPYELLGVVVAVVLGLFGHNLAQAWAAYALGDREPVRQGYGELKPSRQLDPFGAVCCALVVAGWGFPAAVPITSRFRRQRVRATVALLAGPLYLLVLTALAVLLVAHVDSVHLVDFSTAAAVSAAGLFVTSCLPIPPLSGGRLLFLYAPTSPGWNRARYQLTETQTGVLVALAILLAPSLFSALPDVVGELAGPLVRALARAEHAPLLPLLYP